MQEEEKSDREMGSSSNQVLVFRPYPFQVGHKLHIVGGPRRGDWEVIGVGEAKIKLRCPVSKREVEWNRFCYFVEARDDLQWPPED